MSLMQLAQVQTDMGNAKAALASYEEAVKVDREIGDKNGLTQNLASLGSFYLDRGQNDKALSYINEALQIARETADQPTQAMLLLDIGTAHFNKGEFQDALTYFQQAYDIRSAAQSECQRGAYMTWRRPTSSWASMRRLSRSI